MKEFQHNEVALLQELKKAWESFGIFKRWVSRLFHHHNKKISLIKQGEGRNEHTDNIALREFRTNVYLELKRRILASLLTIWTKIRIDEDREFLIPLLISSFQIIDQVLEYSTIERKEFFERVNELIVKASEDLYQIRLRDWNTDDCGSYFDWLKDFSQKEEEVFSQISTINPELNHIVGSIRVKFYTTLIVSYKSTLVESPLGFSYLLANDKFAALRNIKQLLTFYKDDLSIVYDSFRHQVARMINDCFSDFGNQLQEAQDEKERNKLKVVESL